MTRRIRGYGFRARAIAGVVLMLLELSCTSRNTATVDSIVSTFLCSICGGVAIGVVRDGRVVLKKGYGPANREQNTRVTSHTVFDLASVSKQFTGIALLLLVQRGKLSMEDDVRKYVPEVPIFDPRKPIKIGDLSNHRSGLPDASPDETPTEAATLAWLSRQTKLDFPPGSQWAYRNLNYFILGRVVERVSGERFRPFLEREVFLPTGMKDARVLDEPDGVIRNRATGYCFGKPCRSDDGVTGAGGVFASLDDMIAWDAALTHGTLVKLNVLVDAVRSRGYAVGWSMGVQDGHSVMWHDGDSIGASAYIARYLEPHLTVIVLSNQTRLDVEGLERKIARLFP
jgi:CubicO group peptidase (beta-lactamase class C family)